MQKISAKGFLFAGLAALLGLCLLTPNAYSQEDGPTEDQVKKFLDDAESRDDPVILPIRMISVVKDNNGQSMFISENGRYEIKGTIVDKWNKIEVNTYEDAQYARNHIPIQNLDLKPRLLKPFVFGNNEKQKVVAFLSPNGKASRAFLDEIQDLEDDFMFQIIVIPNDLTERKDIIGLSCVADKSQGLQALMAGEGYQNLKVDPACKLVELQNRMIAFGLLGFQAIPAVISPSSLISEGYRQDGWDKFLKENMQ